MHNVAERRELELQPAETLRKGDLLFPAEMLTGEDE
jgi:hypothetical protein